MSQTGGPYDPDRKSGTSSSASVHDAPATTGDRDQPETKAMGDRTRQEAGRLGDQAKERARTMAEDRKSAAADQVRGFADVLHKTSDDLRNQHYDMIGDYADGAARRLEDFAQSMRDKDVSSLLSDVERFARRQPALFLGGAVALGFAMSRFLKASGDHYSREEGYRYAEDFGAEGDGGYYRNDAYRPSPYRSGEYTADNGDRPIPGTTVSGSGGTTAGSTPLSGATTTGNETTGSSGSLGTGGTTASSDKTGAGSGTRSSTGGTHGDQ